jgi:DNA-binding NarL/FixJ family response regulator
VTKLAHQQRFGVDNGNSKLTPHQAALIRRALDEGLTTREIADRFDVCQSTVMQIKKGRTWLPAST